MGLGIHSCGGESALLHGNSSLSPGIPLPAWVSNSPEESPHLPFRWNSVWFPMLALPGSNPREQNHSNQSSRLPADPTGTLTMTITYQNRVGWGLGLRQFSCLSKLCCRNTGFCPCPRHGVSDFLISRSCVLTVNH